MAKHVGRRRQIARKHRCDEYEESLPEAAKVGAVALFVLGLTMCYRFVTLFSMSGGKEVYHMLDELVGISWSVETMAVAIVLAGLLAVSGCMGYVSLQDGRATILSVYTILTSTLFFLFAALLASSVGMDETLGHTISGQVEHLCDPIRHYETLVLLGCEFSTTPVSDAEYERVNATCHADCQEHVERVARWGGCELLNVMCHRFTYSDVGPGDCMVAAENGTSLALPSFVRSLPGQHVSERCCWTICDEGLECTGYVYSEEAQFCKVVMKYQPDPWYLLQLQSTENEGEHEGKHGEEKEEGSAGSAETGEHEEASSTETGTAEEEKKVHLDISSLEEPGPKLRYTQCSKVKWDAPVNMTHRLAVVEKGSGWREFFQDPVPVASSTGNAAEGLCRKKLVKTVIEETILSAGVWLTIMSGFTSLITILAMTCACVIQYQMVPRRARKRQSLRQTMCQMVCPCSRCGRRRSKAKRKSVSWASASESEYSEVESGYSGSPYSRDSDDG